MAHGTGLPSRSSDSSSSPLTTAVSGRVPRAAIIDGAADGNIAALGIITILMIAHQDATAIWLAAFGAGIAEFAGMSVGWYQSTPSDGLRGAGACGLASVTGAVLPALPFLFLSPPAAFAAALVISLAVCLLIGWLHLDGGWRPYAISVLATAAAVGLCILGGLLPH